jgi:hypothetical protein
MFRGVTYRYAFLIARGSGAVDQKGTTTKANKSSLYFVEINSSLVFISVLNEFHTLEGDRYLPGRLVLWRHLPIGRL